MDTPVKPAYDEMCESSRDKPGHDGVTAGPAMTEVLTAQARADAGLPGLTRQSIFERLFRSAMDAGQAHA
ncbi:hypothetical protein [uncultured Bradyrhizobium sp.]|uniref:hypothetical protein n=1 Tax=uncultured Bradyrhizobium sp. TaxID=199684 RepID=UPI0035C98833